MILVDVQHGNSPVTTKVETVQIHPTLNNHKIELHIPQQHSPKNKNPYCSVLVACSLASHKVGLMHDSPMSRDRA